MGVGSLHPLVLAVFFMVVIVSAIVLSHPVFVGVAFVCAVIYAGAIGGRRALLGCVALAVAALVFAAFFVVNVHFGATIVGRTPIGNAVTLESAALGVVTGFKAATVIVWLSCVVSVFTAEKVVHLVGRVSPRAALFVAVALRGCSMISTQMKRFSVAQSGIGCGAGQGSPLNRLRHWISRVSALVSWSIERLGQMSDSMRSRGSSLRGRSAYVLMRFTARDRAASIVLAATFSVFIAGVLLDQARILFDPVIVMGAVTGASFVFYGAYALFLLVPLTVTCVSEVSYRRAASSAGGEGYR